MTDFVQYVLNEVREKRLQKAEALELIKEHKTGKRGPVERHPAGPSANAVNAAGGRNRAAVMLAAIDEGVEQTEVEPSAPRDDLLARHEHGARNAAPRRNNAAEARVRDALRRSLAEALYMKETDVGVKAQFVDLGLDSILGVEWINQVNKEFGVSLSATAVYDHPNLEAFAKYVSSSVANGDTPAVEDARADRQTVSAEDDGPLELVGPARLALTATPDGDAPPAAGIVVSRSAGRADRPYEPIAIVGMSGRYPGAGDLQEFWLNLLNARSSITEIPANRWDVRRYFDPDPSNVGRIYCKWMGGLEDIDCFDPLFFRISPTEAAAMDPQHRIFLQEAHKVFESAGYCATTLDDINCGVYLGIMNNDYSYVSSARGSGIAPEELLVSGTSHSFAIGAARIAYHLNLRGPAIAVDTACSSSFVAAHLACQALRNDEIDMALVGGVTLYLCPESFISMCAAGMLSPEGKCKVFDDSADGFVPGEGVGVILLKRLADAERDGDRILGLIAASGINQDGKTNGLTAPSATRQSELISSTYRKYAIDPNEIGYVETHGTGTRLGDPIELEALGRVFESKNGRRNYCALGSVKSNIGHTSAAAGMASMHKVLLSLRHQLLVPTINYTEPTKHFDFAASAFYVNAEVKYWDKPAGGTRRAGISSFGFSGTNSHLVIEEYASSSPRRGRSPSASNPQAAIVLSARNSERLTEYARDLLQFVKKNKAALTREALLDLAYTMQTGREAMEERVGILASSASELEAKLGRFVDGNGGEGIHRGSAREPLPVDEEEHAPDSAELSELLERWVLGARVDWEATYGEFRPRRIDAPTYPFAKLRYWVAAGQTRSVAIYADGGAETGANVTTQEARRAAFATLIDRVSERTISIEEAAQLTATL